MCGWSTPVAAPVIILLVFINATHELLVLCVGVGERSCVRVCVRRLVLFADSSSKRKFYENSLVPKTTAPRALHFKILHNLLLVFLPHRIEK
jgi:hypothetical protein